VIQQTNTVCDDRIQKDEVRSLWVNPAFEEAAPPTVHDSKTILQVEHGSTKVKSVQLWQNAMAFLGS
jgi:hypothetical protein